MSAVDVAGNAKLAGITPNYRHLLPVESDRPTDDGSIGAESGAPRGIAENRDLRRTLTCFFRCESSADLRADLEHPKEIAGGRDRGEAFRRGAALEVDAHHLVRDELVEHGALPLPVQEVGWRHGTVESRIGGLSLVHSHELFGLRVW